MLPAIAVAAVGMPLAALFIHRAGIANTFRKIGLAFLAIGDAIEHVGVRYACLKADMQQSRVGNA